MRDVRIRIFWCSVIVAAVGSGCGDSPAPEKPPVPVKVHTIAMSDASAPSRYSASIRPDVQVDLAFRVGGYVEDIFSLPGSDGRTRHVQEGDYVRKGIVLARVRDSEYRDRVTEAESTMRRAKADFERASDLYEAKSVSLAEYDAASAQYTSAKARHSQAVEVLEDCTLEAPIDGYVLNRNVEVGALAAVGIPVFVLADTRAVKVVYGVPDVAVGALRIGAAQAITTVAVPGEVFEGTITRISAAADPNSRVFEVECSIPNKENRLKVGMIASLETASTAAAPRTLIPLNAVLRPPGQTDGYAVYVVDGPDTNTVARLRTVTLGEVVGDAIVAESGLQAGERIIMTGATLVTDSQRVRVIP